MWMWPPFQFLAAAMPLEWLFLFYFSNCGLRPLQKVNLVDIMSLKKNQRVTFGKDKYHFMKLLVHLCVCVCVLGSDGKSISQLWDCLRVMHAHWM